MAAVAEMNEVVLRAANPADAAAVHAMIVALAQETGDGGRVRSRAEDFARGLAGTPPAFEVLLAERTGRPVGLCLYFPSFSTWRGERGVYVQDIWVDRAERGTGLARRLIAETARRAAGQGARYLRLSVNRDNAAARRFYGRIGLEHVERECVYMAAGEGFDALTRADATPPGIPNNGRNDGRNDR